MHYLTPNMTDLVLTLNPQQLENPDLDLRYVVPDLMSARSNGNIRDEGYDYEDQQGSSSPLMAIFLSVIDLPAALKTIGQVLSDEDVLGNRLAPAAALYLREGSSRSPISVEEHKT
jgi:hypothetical protein